MSSLNSEAFSIITYLLYTKKLTFSLFPPFNIFPFFFSVYCSVIMLILFTSSCQWSDRCFLDTNNGHWFEPRMMSHPSVSSTSSTIAPGPGVPMSGEEVSSEVGAWAGLGLEWLRSTLGRREWRLPCVDVNIRL